MPETIVITPVKDSWKTTIQTIEAISKANGDFKYCVFNDFSRPETKENLVMAEKEFGFQLINMEDFTSAPSPNYKLVLEMAQKMALKSNVPLIIVESDVIVNPDIFTELLKIDQTYSNSGLIGAITVDKEGNYNFPYTHVKLKNNKIIRTSRSVSFCCTLISLELLKKFDFKELSDKKDWYDVFLSRKSIKLGFSNYLAKGIRVLHLPHSSRPWKQLKYKNPFLYYLKKYSNKRDRI